MNLRVNQGFFLVEVLIAVFISMVGGLVLYNSHAFINKKLCLLEERKKMVWIAEQSLMYARWEGTFGGNQPSLPKEDWERSWVLTPFIDVCQTITVTIRSPQHKVTLGYLLCSPERTKVYR